MRLKYPLIVAAIIAIVAIFAQLTNDPRVVTINSGTATSTNPIDPATTTDISVIPITPPTSTNSTTPQSQTTSGYTLPPITLTNLLGASSTMTPLDKNAYDEKLLAIANLPIITKTIKVSSTFPGSSTVVFKTMSVTSTAKTGWPVKTAYPNAGALLPFHRIVAYYGNLYSTQMGILGEYPEDEVLSRLASTSAQWAAADPSTSVIPALDYIVVAAQAGPGSDGKYRLRMPDDQIDKVLAMAQKVNGLVFLDVQVGLSSVETEVPLLEKYLKMPQVELSLDPEFDMHDGARPGSVIGTMDASDINFAAQYLANLVQQNHLPPKILVVHRFTQDMVTRYKDIQPLPDVQVVMDMDGFGFPAKKINTYQQVIVPEPVQFTGFKLFYKNDAKGPQGHLMTPAEVLKLSPEPSYIQYQ